MVPLIPKALILSFRDTVDSLSTSDDGGVDVDEDDVDEVDDDEDDGGDVEDDDVIDDDDAAADDILDSLSFDWVLLELTTGEIMGTLSVCSLSSFSLFSTHFLFCSVAVADSDVDDDIDVGISGISSDVNIVTDISSSCLASTLELTLALTVSNLAIAITESMDSTSSLLSLLVLVFLLMPGNNNARNVII